jgi:hypothetical protein
MFIDRTLRRSGDFSDRSKPRFAASSKLTAFGGFRQLNLPALRFDKNGDPKKIYSLSEPYLKI